jgi:nicotinamidase-related amidase
MEPKKTALILIGYQNDYFAQDGILRGVVQEADRVDHTLAHTLDLIRKLSPTPVSIVSTPIILNPDYRALASPVGILHAIKESGAFRAGSKGAENIPELAAFGDRITYVSGKVGFNAFANTRLDTVLQEAGVTDLLVAGMVTALCVDSTGRAGYERGYRVSILSDCTSARTRSEQDFYCRNVFPLYGSVLNNHQVFQELRLN